MPVVEPHKKYKIAILTPWGAQETWVQWVMIGSIKAFNNQGYNNILVTTSYQNSETYSIDEIRDIITNTPSNPNGMVIVEVGSELEKGLKGEPTADIHYHNLINKWVVYLVDYTGNKIGKEEYVESHGMSVSVAKKMLREFKDRSDKDS